jgi:hypothetical protein
MAHTPEHLAALERALASGEQRVSFGDRTVEYRSIQDLERAIAIVRRDLQAQAIAAGTAPRRPRRLLVHTRKDG